MFIVTGGAGLIGSAVLWRLNRAGIDDVLVVDHLGTTDKWKNLAPLRFDESTPVFLIGRVLGTLDRQLIAAGPDDAFLPRDRF